MACLFYLFYKAPRNLSLLLSQHAATFINSSSSTRLVFFNYFN